MIEKISQACSLFMILSFLIPVVSGLINLYLYIFDIGTIFDPDKLFAIAGGGILFFIIGMFFAWMDEQ